MRKALAALTVNCLPTLDLADRRAEAAAREANILMLWLCGFAWRIDRLGGRTDQNLIFQRTFFARKLWPVDATHGGAMARGAERARTEAENTWASASARRKTGETAVE